MDFLGGSIRLFQFAGINVRVHSLYLIWMAFELINARGGFATELLYLLTLFLIILIHEFGHCFGARSVGGDAQEILMWPLGGLAFADAPMRAWPQFVTVACGPLVNVIFCLVSWLILAAQFGTLGVVSINPLVGSHVPWSAPGLPGWIGWLSMFYHINLILLAFNLLPVFPLDGGQLFRSIIWPFVGLQRATIIASVLGLVGAVGLAGLGVWTLNHGGSGISLIVIAAFGGFVSWQHLQAARGRMIHEEFITYEHAGRERRKGPGLWARLRGRGSGPTARPVEFPGAAANPNPGGWQARQEEAARLNAEVDRILTKVKESGIQSLTYIERQTLEHATRARQERERQYQDRG